jgi:hypothetical protein
MQLLIAIELALMLGLALKVSIGNIERELTRKPYGVGDTDLSGKRLNEPDGP